MAELVAGFLGPAIEVVRWIGAPIMRQFNYLCCFTTNIANLKLEVEELQNAAGDLQDQVERARDNVQVISREVEAWLIKSNDIKDKTNGILNESTNLESGCLKVRARFSLSRRAKKTTDGIKELRGQGTFDVISHPGPPPARTTTPLGVNTYEFESRKQIEEDIMTSLRGGDVNMIGICGMGGLGKTTMAKMIMNRALKDHLFDEAVMAVVSQPVDKLKIQLEIGGQLGLMDFEKETSEASRVQRLHARLTASTKRILLVLDDVWERLRLEELGILRASKGCTILLTSRNNDVLGAMNVQKENIFGMEVLTKEDAWFLFRGRAGTCVDDTRLNSLAKEVVKECAGLPIALTTVGAALKDKNDKGIWEYVLLQLRTSNLDCIPDFIEEVYNPLKKSYDKLESQEVKSVFLLCCLFNEGADIPVEKLTYLFLGLGIFKAGIITLEETRNWMSELIRSLKSQSLLLDGYNEDHVRMHDIVRDLCIFIAKEKGYIGGNDCTWISSSETTVGKRTKLPTNLRLLFLSGNYSEQEEEINKFDNSFVEGIRDLQVLFIENYSSLTSLPHTTQSLRNLNTLMLYSCEKLETISIVEELLNLEILICRDCDSIKELPPEIKRLNRLKLLDVTGCGNLERIGGGIISSLVGLEELKMLNSFNKWEVAWDRKERQNANASLRELEALINLRCLEIDINDPAAQNVHLSSKLERFHIRFPGGYYNNRKMHLHLEGDTCAGDWIKMLLERDTEYLHLTGNGANNVELAKNENMRWSNVEHLSLFSLPSNSYQNLKQLSLGDFLTLKQCWNNYYNISVFTNLSSIKISRCPRLRSLGQFSTAGHNCLANLQILLIEECEMMEQVFLWNEENIHVKIFPKLKFLSLSFLPKLKNICKGIERLQCPELDKMRIVNCPRLESLVYWAQELTFIFNSRISSQLPRGKGANTALQPRMFKKEEKQQQNEVGEQSNLSRKTTTEDEDEGIKGEIEEERNWKSTTEKEGRKGEIEEEQNWKTTAKGGRKCEIEEE